MTLDPARSYPIEHAISGETVLLRLMSAADRQAVVSFARALPEHDLLFLRRDITDPDVVDEWLAQIEAGTLATILAFAGDALVGYGTLQRESLRWSRHLGEIRILVAPEHRSRGLGRTLTQEVFATALHNGIEKIVARMTRDQRGAISTFQGLGFRVEALLRDHVKDRNGTLHDLLLMSHDVAEFERTLTSYGVEDALGAGPG